MLAAELRNNSFNIHKIAVSEIHRSKISKHRVKKGYHYPTVRLPHQSSALAGLPACIYQTVHKGALAFLVIVSGSSSVHENASEDLELPALT
jgi:hypothetical protein